MKAALDGTLDRERNRPTVLELTPEGLASAGP
jgi:hypothetical protein